MEVKEKLVITMDASGMKAFLTCEQQWALGYVENLRRFGAKTFALDRGSMVHKMLEIFYILRSHDPKTDRFKQANIVMNLFRSGKLLRASSLTAEDEKFIFERFTQYVMKWMSHDFVPLKRGSIPAVEIGFSKVLLETDDFMFIVEGKIDLLTKLPTGEPCFVDNKTQDRLSWLYPFKPQFLTYSWATGFKWGMINYFRFAAKYEDEITFQRTLFYVEDSKIKEWKSTMINIFWRIYEVMIANDITDMSNLKAEMFHQNLGSCAGAWESNKCYFCQICEDDGRRKEAIKRTYYVKVPKWIPWTEVENGD